MQKFLVAILLIATSLAGCLSGGNGGLQSNLSNVGSNEDFELPFHFTEIDSFHNHSDPAHHDIANNITLEAFMDLGPDGAPGSYISEMHVADDYLFIADMRFGFHIVDIADPLNPVLVTSYNMLDDTTDDEFVEQRNVVYDQVRDVNDQTPDCDLAFNCNVPLLGIPTVLYMADLKTDDAGDWLFVAVELTSNPGVFVYDVRDKTNPTLAGFYPAPGTPPGTLLGCHMVEYAVIGGQEYLFCVPLDDSVYVGLIQPANDQGIRQILPAGRWTPLDAENSPNDFQSIAADPQGLGHYSVLGGHQDMTWQKDPLTGADVLSVSLWGLGWYWVDVSNPAVPIQLGAWKGEGSPDYGANTHTMMLAEYDGRRIAMGIPEVAHTPVFHILDVTDYANPEVLSHWNAVDNWHGEAGRFSTHNFQVVEGKVYLTHYHGGVVVLDVSTEERLEDPHLAGTFMPMDRRPDTYGRHFQAGFDSWDIVVWKGYAFTANKAGLSVIHLNDEPIHDDYSGFA